MPLTHETIPTSSLCEVTTCDGRTVTGTLFQTGSIFWLNSGNTTAFVFTEPYTALRILKTAEQVYLEREARKFGTLAYTQPIDRDDYERVLWSLATAALDAYNRSEQAPSLTEAMPHSVRHGQLEAQFNRVADEIGLSRNKRRYMLATAYTHAAGHPMPHPAAIADGPLDALRFDVPKHTDFDPNPAIRRKRSLKPPHAYMKREIVQALLANALSRAERSRSPAIRARMARLAKRHTHALETGKYREAVEELGAQASSSICPTP